MLKIYNVHRDIGRPI